MSRTRTQRRNSQKLQPSRVAEALFHDQPVEHQGWLIRINADTDMVEVFPPNDSPRAAFEAPLTHLDTAVRDFCREAAMPIPGVNETQGPQVKLPGSANEILGEDSSVGEGPSEGKPKINKLPKGLDQKGTSAPNTNLGEDSTSKAPAQFNPAVTKRPVNPDGRGGLPDVSLGSDTSGASTNWRDKVVNIQENGRNARLALHEVKNPRRGPGQLGVGKAQMGEEAAPMVDGSDGREDSEPTGAPDADIAMDSGPAASDGGGSMGAVGRRAADGKDPFDRPVVEEPGKKKNTGETPVDPAKVIHTPQGQGKDQRDESEGQQGKKSRFVDSFENPQVDPSQVYRQMTARRPSKELLRDIMDEGKWAANNVFMPKTANFEVVVQGLGKVYEGDSYREAEEAFQEYTLMSVEGYGQAAGKSVALLEDGELVDEFTGERDVDPQDVLHGDPEGIGLTEYQAQRSAQTPATERALQDVQNVLRDSPTERALQDVQQTQPVTPTEQALEDVYSTVADWNCPSCGDYGTTDEVLASPEGRTLCPSCMEPVEVAEGKAASRRVAILKIAQWAFGDTTTDAAAEALIDAGYDPVAAAQAAEQYAAGDVLDTETTAIIELALQQGSMSVVRRLQILKTAQWAFGDTTVDKATEALIDAGYDPVSAAQAAEQYMAGDVLDTETTAIIELALQQGSQSVARRQTDAKVAGPRLKENWGNDGGYNRDLEAESAEELHALTTALGGAEVDWSKFRPQLPGAEDGAGSPDDAPGVEATAPEQNQVPQPESQQATSPPVGTAPVQARMEGLRPFSDSSRQAETGGDLEAGCGAPPEREEKEAVDDAAKDYWQDYFKDSDYGKALTRDEAPKKKEKMDKGKDARRAAWRRAQKTAQAAAPAAPAPQPAPQAPAGAPATPGAPAGGAPIPGGAPAPKGPVPGMSPGTGDQGLQALGWTSEDISLMDEEDKKKVLQVQLTKPGTKKAPQAPDPGKPEAAPAPAPAPAPATPAAPAAPVPPPVAARMSKLLERKLNQRRVVRGQQVAPPLAPAAPAATSPAPKAPAAQPAQPAPAPGAPGASPAPGIAEEVGDLSNEESAFQILSEVQQMAVEATTSEQVTSLKASKLAERLLKELGMTMTEARELFGLASNKSFSSLLQ